MKENKSRHKRKGYIKTYVSGFIRAFVIALLLLFQFGIIFLLSYYLIFGVYIYFAVEIVSVFVVIGLVNKRTNASFKIGWLVTITLVPLAGLVMYLLWGANRSNRIKRRNLYYIRYGEQFLKSDKTVLSNYIERYQRSSNAVTYLENCNFPLFGNNSFTYYPMGEDAFEAIIEDLEKAEKFIFIDFFIVADGILWNKIKEILLEKAKMNVEIKFLYDDYGSMFRTSKQLWNELKENGIEVAEFNSIGKYIDKLYLNYRSHQKIVVIDGKVGYTGGFNLADEYVNAVSRFGIWKDTGVRIEGDGVFGLTATFLQMWTMTTEKLIEDYNIYKYNPKDDIIDKSEYEEACQSEDKNIDQYETVTSEINDKNKLSSKSGKGFCQIISDGPANNPENPIADTLLQIIYSSSDYIYITTPYLILDDDIMEALAISAKRGTDVRIITPGIPDKKIIYQLTKYSYGYLLENGVRIFEYTPGFMHAKTILTDECALVGTINLDFRSLYIHYECGALMWDKNMNTDIMNDFKETMDASKEITLEEWKKRPVPIKIIQNFFNLFSSLM
ncbi:MAG: PLDc N-terminal domain-containing protein [Lachnospiraceae bacterium]|nr:PLDc N-terminal domain-containing protein [Lachnospiraceae bacterium]